MATNLNFLTKGISDIRESYWNKLKKNLELLLTDTSFVKFNIKVLLLWKLIDSFVVIPVLPFFENGSGQTKLLDILGIPFPGHVFLFHVNSRNRFQKV